MEQNNLFELFDKVEEVTGFQAYDEYDQNHLQSIYRVYLAERKYLAELKTVEETYLTAIAEEKVNFTSYFFDLVETPDTSAAALSKANEKLIAKCIAYLESRHGCKIPDIENPDRKEEILDRWGEKKPRYAGEEIRLEDVLDRIQVAMGGFDFSAKRIQEIKEEFRETIGRRNTPISQKSNTLSIELWGSFYEQDYFGRDNYRMRYNYHPYANALANGIRLFGGDDSKSGWVDMFPDDRGKDITFSPVEIRGVKGVQSVKFFKNGRIDIKFDDAKVATRFAHFYGLTIAESKAS